MARPERKASGRRRAWRRAAAIVLPLLLLIAAVAAISWHFSDEVVVPNHSEDPFEIEVIAVEDGRVELERTEQTERPGIYGIEWPGGHGIVGEIFARDDEADAGADEEPDTVARRLRVTEGEPAPGEKVRFDTYVFQDDPLSGRGIPYETVPLQGELGPMPAWLMGPASNRRWTIVVHGINSTPRAALPIAPTLINQGFSVLSITYRNDEGAPASPDGKLHMGLTEWRDVEPAVRYALHAGARELILIGHSMGGAIVTQFIERSPLAEDVDAMILDAPALDWPATISFGARQMGLPGFAAKPVEWMIGLRIDADWKQLDALAHTEELALPTLLFHGTEDKRVPIESSDAFAAALPETVTYYRVPRAGHVQSWNVDPPLYEKRVREFLASLPSG